jgi:hypothetical protein
VVPAPATLVKTDFFITSKTKWGGWFQTICFDQEKRYIYTYGRFTRVHDLTNK